MTSAMFVPFTPSGADEVDFIQRTRQWLRDSPRFRNEMGSGSGMQTQYQLQQVPFNDDQFFRVTVDDVLAPWTTTFNPDVGVPAGQVYVDFDTGVLIFGTPPSDNTNNISIQKRSVRWRDSQILFALRDGLRRMFPKLWTYNVLDGNDPNPIRIAVNQYDYPLPPDFADPRVKIITVESQDIPSGVEPFRIGIPWSRPNPMTLHVPCANAFTPGTMLRITYMGPYRTISEAAPLCGSTPIWYAAGMLMGGAEAPRTRVDGQTVAAGEGANPPGYLQQTAQWFMARFDQDLSNFQMARPRRQFRAHA